MAAWFEGPAVLFWPCIILSVFIAHRAFRQETPSVTRHRSANRVVPFPAVLLLPFAYRWAGERSRSIQSYSGAANGE